MTIVLHLFYLIYSIIIQKDKKDKFYLISPIYNQYELICRYSSARIKFKKDKPYLVGKILSILHARRWFYFIYFNAFNKPKP